MPDLATQTIHDFGDQFTHYRSNDGFYGSLDLLRDVFGPLLSVDDLRGKVLADIGSGTGRIVRMLLAAGAQHVTAIEPSAAFEVLRDNIGGDPRVTCIQATGEHISPEDSFDYVLSIGVLHHVPNPKPIVEAANTALRPGGQFVVWLYGREGNRAYLMVAKPLRWLTSRLPHSVLAGLVRLLDVGLVAYLKLGERVSVPLRSYLPILRQLTPDKRRLVLFDQLKPAYAKYYTQQEARGLLEGVFDDVRLYHRRGYSWTVMGRKGLSESSRTTTA